MAAIAFWIVGFLAVAPDKASLIRMLLLTFVSGMCAKLFSVYDALEGSEKICSIG